MSLMPSLLTVKLLWMYKNKVKVLLLIHKTAELVCVSFPTVKNILVGIVSLFFTLSEMKLLGEHLRLFFISKKGRVALPGTWRKRKMISHVISAHALLCCKTTKYCRFLQTQDSGHSFPRLINLHFTFSLAFDTSVICLNLMGSSPEHYGNRRGLIASFIPLLFPSPFSPCMGINRWNSV